MGRLLLLVALIAVGFFLFRRLANPPPAAGGQPPGAGRAQPPATAHMLMCAHCGAHAPEDTGVRYQNLFFCSPEHLSAWLARQGK